MKTIFALLIVFVLSFSQNIYAQNDSITIDNLSFSIKPKNFHSPKLATYLSIIPGGGQIYNKKYWKLPIIYAGLGTAAYFIYYYNGLTQMYKQEYVYRVNNNVPYLDPYFADDPTENILASKYMYQSRMEIGIAAFVIVYALNLVDAAVDAHLYYFDVSDDLSMSFKPTIQLNQFPNSTSFSPGIGVKLKFK